MLPPLLRVLLTEPGLLHTYVSAYGELLYQDASYWWTSKQRRLGYTLAMVGCAVLAILFIGVALMLHAVTGNVHWLLWVVPALPVAGALAALWLRLRMPRERASFLRVRAQIKQDMQLLEMDLRRSER
jgi:hypothetical protein